MKRLEECTEKELAKYMLVMTMITMGKSKCEIVKHMASNDSNLTVSKAGKLYDETLQFITFNSKEYINHLRDVNIERLTMLYETAVREGKTKVAADILDTMNKTSGVYTNKLEITSNTKFKFVFDGDEDADAEKPE